MGDESFRTTTLPGRKGLLGSEQGARQSALAKGIDGEDFAVESDFQWRQRQREQLGVDSNGVIGQAEPSGSIPVPKRHMANARERERERGRIRIGDTERSTHTETAARTPPAVTAAREATAGTATFVLVSRRWDLKILGKKKKAVKYSGIYRKLPISHLKLLKVIPRDATNGRAFKSCSRSTIRL